MSRFGKLLKRGPKPIFAKSHYIYTEDIKATPFMKKTAGSGLSMKPDIYYVVASVNWVIQHTMYFDCHKPYNLPYLPSGQDSKDDT